MAAEHARAWPQPRRRRCGRDRRRATLPAGRTGRRSRRLQPQSALWILLSIWPSPPAQDGNRLGQRNAGTTMLRGRRAKSRRSAAMPNVSMTAEATATPENFLTTQPHAIVEREGVRYTLLGTAHVSRTSIDAVKEAIGTGRFDSV